MTRSRSRLAENAEKKFPVRVRIGLSNERRSQLYDKIHNWLLARYGRDGYAWTGGMIPGFRDASLVFFPDLTGAAKFMAAFPTLEFAADTERSLW